MAKISFADEPANEIYWDEGKGILSYKIPKDSLVKIRAGSAEGPVYRTLVNSENKFAGMNQELWNGKDESDSIDFKNYGPLHFCVDTLPSSEKDLSLSVSGPYASKGPILIKGEDISLTLDIDDSSKSSFCEGPLEAMVFLDKKLVRIKRVDKLPYSLNIGMKNLSYGEHLLSLNVWPDDHTSVAYRSILVIKESGAVSAPVKKAQEPAADHGRLAYCQRIDGFWQVWTADSAGRGGRRLTKSPVDKRYPRFSHDGKRIAYVTNDGELWILDANGRDNHKVNIAMHASQPRWSQDDKKMLFVSYENLYYGDSEIWEADLETLKLTKLTNRPWMQYDPCYSRDGSDIIFSDGPELYAQEICRLNLKTGDITQVTDNGPYDYDMQPSYSSDGENIVYASNQGGDYDVWLMDRYGRKPVNLTRNPAHDIMPCMDKTGRWIYFLSDRSGAFEVWRIDTDGGSPRQVTDDKKEKQDLDLYAQAR